MTIGNSRLLSKVVERYRYIHKLKLRGIQAMQYAITFLLGLAAFLCGWRLIDPGSDPTQFQDALGLTRETPWSVVAVACLIVFGIYVVRFRQWVDDTQKPSGFPSKPTRHFTTWVHYFMWASAYAATGVCLVLLVWQHPSELTRLLVHFAGFAAGDQETISVASTARMAKGGFDALLLGVTAALAFLSFPYPEKWLRSTLQRAAFIPSRATSLVGKFIDDFDTFRPGGEDVEQLAERSKKHPVVPRLYKADFRAPGGDEGFLEIYPRIEFMLWKLSRLDAERRMMMKTDRYKEELSEIETEMATVRDAIFAVRETVQKLFGDRFSAEIAALHAENGYERYASEPLSVLLLDNIAKSVKGWSKATDPQSQAEDEVLVEHITQTLTDLRKRCDRLLEALMRVVVLMALRSYAPQNALNDAGFGAAQDGHYRIGWDILPFVVLFLMVSSAAVAMIYNANPAQPTRVSVEVYAFGMTTSAVLTAYLMATVVASSGALAAAAPGDGVWMRERIVCFLGSWFAVIIMLWMISFLGENYASPSALSYAHVPAVIGVYVSHAFFRGARGAVVFRWADLLVVPMLAALAAGIATAVAVGGVPQLVGNVDGAWLKAGRAAASAAITASVVVFPFALIPYFMRRSGAVVVAPSVPTPRLTPQTLDAAAGG